MKSVYIAHQISGLSASEVFEWFDYVRNTLQRDGYTVMSPMTGKEEFRNELKFKEHGYEGNPVVSNHAIYERDKWMVTQADIIFMDLTGTTYPSIGCMHELAWASILGKHTVLVLPKENPHCHAFVLESADIIFEDVKDALEYMRKIAY